MNFRIKSAPIIQDNFETLLSYLAMSANAKWQDTPTPAVVRSLAQRGWYLGRWLPTFLIIDGQLGRFLKDYKSPLNSTLKCVPPLQLSHFVVRSRDLFGCL